MGTREKRRRLPRHQARQRAVELLYEADLRGEDPHVTLTRAAAEAGAPLDAFTRQLVEGVAAHRGALDTLLGELSRGWRVERMAAVDRNILRLGAYELVHTDTPVAVAISEAVELAKLLSTERSPAFVNGLLSGVERRLVRTSEGDDPP